MMCEFELTEQYLITPYQNYAHFKLLLLLLNAVLNLSSKPPANDENLLLRETISSHHISQSALLSICEKKLNSVCLFCILDC